MLRLLSLVLIPALMLLLHVAAMAAQPAATGMVLDVQGSGEVLQQGTRSKLQLLGYVQPGATITLDAGARASVSHYRARLIYRLAGPVQVRIEADGVRHLSGNAAQTLSLAEKTVSAALHPNLGAAALKLRTLPHIVVQSPVNGSSILSARPTFRWESSEPGSYQVDVVELPDRLVAQGSTDANTWELPPQTALAYGKSYRWSVASVPAAGARVRTAVAGFNLPSKADADMLGALAPAADAPADEWVLYASILKEWNMQDEAKGVWRRIALLRPDLVPAR